jgi:hypothetical protein
VVNVPEFLPSFSRLTPPQVLDRLLPHRERIDALKRVKLAGYEVAIAELEVERNLLLRARRYLEQVTI